MAQDLRSAMLLGYTRKGRPVFQIAGAEGDGGEGKGGAGDKGGEGDQIDVAAAKEAMAVVAKMKEAGVEDPSSVLDLVGKLRPFEKGEKLPAAVKKQLDELQTKVADFEKGKLSDSEKTAKQIEDLTKQVAEATERGKARSIKAAFLSAATKAKALYPEDVHKLVDAAAVEFDDDGNPTNAEALVDKIKKDRPALFRAPSSFDQGARKTASGATDMNALMRQAAGRPS